MRHGLMRRTIAATIAAVLVLQSTPAGIVSAHAAGVDAAEQSRELTLEEELSAKAAEYPEGGFAFYTASAEMAESDGDLAVKVVRWGNTDAEATLDVKAVDLTASYGDDYAIYYQDNIFFRSYMEESDATAQNDAENAEDAAAQAEEAEDAEAADEAASSEDASATDDAATVDDASEDGKADDARAADEATGSEEAAEAEKVEATPVDNTGLDAEGNPVATDEGAASDQAAGGEAPEPSLRSAYSTQTGTETVNTNWRGEYEDYLEQAAAVEGANEIASALPGAELTLSFAAGEYEKTLYVHLEDDDRAESDEAFKLVLGNASTGVLASQMQFDVTIVDDEGDVPILFAMRDAEVKVDAAADTAEVVIERTSGIDYYAGAVVRTVSGTAQAGEGYVALDGVTVPFAPGETEHTITVELAEPGEGTYFDVKIDAEETNVSAGNTQTRVVIGDAAAADADEAAEGPLAGVEQVSSTGVGVMAADPSQDVTQLASSRAVTVDGVVYDESNINLSNWSSPMSDGLDSSSWVYGTISALKEATRVRFAGHVNGYTDCWIFGKPAYKNYTIKVGGQKVVSSSTSSKSYWYDHTVDLNWGMSSSPEVYFEAKATSTNQHAQITCEQMTAYFPRYTLTLAKSDAKQTLKGRNYTTTSAYTQFDVSTLSGDPSWSKTTVSRYGGVSLFPGTVTPGVEVDRYDLYAGNTKVFSTKSSYLSYSDLNNIRASYDSVLRSAKYQITVKPVYKVKSAIVTFASEDASAIAFSGNKAGQSGFKVGDRLSATQIDRVTFTATCPNDQRVKVGSVTRSRNASASAFFTLTPTTDNERTSFKRTIELDNSTEELKVYYQDFSLTYQYHPDEADAPNAGVGSVLVYDLKNVEDPLGASVVGKPFSVTGDAGLLRNTYLANVLGGDGFETVTGPNGITYSTKTIWTYSDKAGVWRSTLGNSLLFKPYFADETVYYHFKSVQDDEVQVGVKGTVYVDETPLFSSDDKVTSKPAVGVQLNVGGENAVTANDGTYTIPARFNKGEYVSAFMSYDTLTSVEEVPLSQDTVHDFHINVDDSESLTVADSAMSKSVNTGERDMSNKVIYEEKPVEAVLLEDTQYTFQVVANGSAGVTPGRAEFRFYGKDGQLKSSATKSVNFSGNTATLKINPVQANLAVGDSMTVKLYDTNGNGCFEHQTSVILGEKMEGMYTFNYEGAVAEEDDNLFIQALGGISEGYDFVLDALSSNGGTYADEDGQHQLVYIGFGDGFSNEGKNAEEEVYQTMTEAVQNIKEVNAGDYKLDHSDDISIFSNKSWAVNVSVGAIYDMVMQDEGDHKGEFMFSHYLLLADVGANYYREWEIPVSSIKLKFTLGFNFGNSQEGLSGASIKWHFYNPDDEELYVKSNDSIDLMASDDVESEGYFGLNVGIVGSAGVIPTSFLEILGQLEVEVNNNVMYDGALTNSKWADSGSIILAPTVKIKVLKIPIPLWTDTWRFDWHTRDEAQGGRSVAEARMMNAVSENLSGEKILYTTTDGAEAVDYSYTEDRPAWGAGSVASALSAIRPKSAESVEEQVLQQGFLSDADISVQDLGGGRYLAVFLDAVSGRSDENKMAAYYSVYNGSSWSAPELLESDDGTEDQAPVICEAGNKGYLVVWSDASRAFGDEDPMVDRLNSFDLTGRFFGTDGEPDGDVMAITTTTKDVENPDGDAYADASPQLTYFEDEKGQQHLKIYYTKSEYEVTDPEEGEVVGDLMNPYQVIAVRDYNLDEDKWVDTYSPEIEAQIKEQLKAQQGVEGDELEAAYDAYVKSWYGQQFLNLAPAVSVSESLDEYGYWEDGTTAQITELDESVAQQRMQKDSAAIGYDGLSLLAYSLDEGGMAQTTGDQKLYLQIYNANDGEYHHPIQITSQNADISDIQFVRTAAPDGDNSSNVDEITWLYWKEDVPTAADTTDEDTGDAAAEEDAAASTTRIRRMNITSLVSDEGNLIKGTTSSGQEYYYINKTDPGEGVGYTPPTTLVESTAESEQDDAYVSIGNFKVRSSHDGAYNFIAWTQPVSVETEDGDARQEWQLFAMREDVSTGEFSLPVQLTDTAKQYITQFDMAVTEEGDLDVLAAREFLAEQPVLDAEGKDTGTTTWQADESTSELTFMHITPKDTFAMSEVTQTDARISDEGAPEVTLEGTVMNDSFASRKDVVIEAVDNFGKTVWSTADAQEVIETETTDTADGGVTFDDTVNTVQPEPLTMAGGERYDFSCAIPTDGKGFYDVNLRVRAGGDVLAEQRVSGTIPETLTSTGLASEVSERDHVTLSTTVKNAGVLSTEARKAAYGYVDEDGTAHELGTVEIPALKTGETHDLSVDVETNFADFTSKRAGDGSLSATRRFYLDLDPNAAETREASEDAAEVEPTNLATVLYRDVTLSATAEQVAVMDALGELSAAYTTYDDEANLVQLDSLEPGSQAILSLTSDGKIAQNEDALVNGFKVVWDPVDTDVAEVTEDGSVTAKANGEITVTGRIMPADDASAVYSDGSTEDVDGSVTLPAELFKTVSAKLVIGTGEQGGSDSGSGDQGEGNQPGPDGGGSDQGSNQGDSSSHEQGSDSVIPGTGDPVSMVMIAVVAAGGVALVTVGTYWVRRKKKGDNYVR